MKERCYLVYLQPKKLFWKKMIWLFSYMCTVHKLFRYDLYWIMVLVLSTPVIKVGHLLSELGFDLETSDTLLIII